MNLEEALIKVSEATDSEGRRVILYSGPITSDGLRKAAKNFASELSEESIVFFGGSAGEAKAWENLALLANAVAAAILEGK